MTDHKFTDDDVIKALRELQEMSEFTPPICHYEKDITEPPFCKPFEQFQNDVNAALSLINRQKVKIDSLQGALERADYYGLKADEENEHLKVELDAMRGAANSYKMHYEKAKSEAVKEFAERIKAIFECDLCFDDDVKECILNEIDELVKEMTENKR